MGGLRNLAVRLEELVHAEPAHAESDSPVVDQDPSLEESLRPSVAVPESSEPHA